MQPTGRWYVCMYLHHRAGIINRRAMKSTAVVVPDPSLSHLREIVDRLESNPKGGCLRDTTSTSHSTPE
jgi:hypothetical protein